MLYNLLYSVSEITESYLEWTGKSSLILNLTTPKLHGNTYKTQACTRLYVVFYPTMCPPHRLSAANPRASVCTVLKNDFKNELRLCFYHPTFAWKATLPKDDLTSTVWYKRTPFCPGQGFVSTIVLRMRAIALRQPVYLPACWKSNSETTVSVYARNQTFSYLKSLSSLKHVARRCTTTQSRFAKLALPYFLAGNSSVKKLWWSDKQRETPHCPWQIFK